MTVDVTTTPDRPRFSGRGVARRVFWPSLAVVVLVSAYAIIAPAHAERTIGAIQDDVIGAFGWYYVLLVAGFVVFALWVGLGRWGDVTLGNDDDEPRFGLGTWFAMLFAAGMGIGLVFYGVAEPLMHYASPKPGVVGSPERLAETAMAQTYLHWGVHAWAIYVVVGLAMAYAIHRRGRPVSIRWALEPLLGRRVEGRWGDAVDVTAVVGTVFGVATSLGLGVLQIAAGLEHIGVIESGAGVQVAIIVVITVIATASVVSGLDRGLKWLSNINVGLAGVLLVVLLVLGPTLFLLREFVQSIGVYLSTVVPMTFNVSAFAGAEGEAWQAAWTTFYWGWWISWAPFVGIFIARISRGRTVRQFVGGVLLVPTLVSFLWFSVLGGTALYRELFGTDGVIPADGAIRAEFALFDLLASLPWAPVLSVVVIVLVSLFFITSSDSGSLVVAMLSSGGNPVPPTGVRVTWALLEGVLAIALLLAGGLLALQTAAILIALPFSLVMVAMAAATARALHREHQMFLRAQRRELRARLTEHVSASVTAQVTTMLEEGTPDRAPRGRRWRRRS
ncbi:BCCT family transporter [Cellulomonas bogoriensis]|uniref:Choline transporter n=1 Tax=Cellulomonas bogoriensis 69B4 = DSM 16987 TaxID=1386082 RepID=A0A0A0C1P4_9CELL|nr:BCCT family transporter [Cellulomonas bogoriensis]KGM13887.1 choline transporter [Cellulomonas bogoriensis 69B4 = DSM 16987]